MRWHNPVLRRGCLPAPAVMKTANDLADSDAVLISVPPTPQQDPAPRAYAWMILRGARFRLLLIGYVSTVGVYGDHAGAAGSMRRHRRPAADGPLPQPACGGGAMAGLRCAGAWHSMQVFRLAGNSTALAAINLVQLAEGKAHRIIKPGQVSNRIHAEDIAQIVAGLTRETSRGGDLQRCRQEPAPPPGCRVVRGNPVRRGTAAGDPVRACRSDPDGPAVSSWKTKRVRNRLRTMKLGVTLRYPTYREGLTALASRGRWSSLRQSGIARRCQPSRLEGYGSLRC